MQYDPQNEDWYWFSTEDANYFGIKKTALHKEQLKLFNQLFQPVSLYSSDYVLSANQLNWKKFLFSDVEFFPATMESKVRFYYFKLERPIEHYAQLMEIVSEFFFKAITIPEDSTHFVVIEERPSSDQIHLEELIDILMNDFATKLHVYIGQFQKIDASLKQKFVLEHALFKSFYPLQSKQKILYFQQALPTWMASNTGTKITDVLSLLLLEALEDIEMTHSINTFLKNNLNISLAAKKLFIHRNSLLYRIEKFQEITGLDIRYFQDAAFVSYCLLLKENQI